MPEPGLSLVGFLGQPEAATYFSQSCMLANDPISTWQEARDKIGAPLPRAGVPEIEHIPSSYNVYLQGVEASPRFADTVASLAWSFKLVEVDPLIAFQFHIFKNRASTLWASMGDDDPRDIDRLLGICLPHTLEDVPFKVAGLPNSLMIEAASPNLRLLGAGIFGADPTQRQFAGAVFGVSSPLVQVVRFGGRCYLKNGYHRVYAARMAGVTHLPCILLETADYTHVGALAPGFFERSILESENPPTMGHFSQGRAYDVMLKGIRRVITLSWSEYSLPE